MIPTSATTVEFAQNPKIKVIHRNNNIYFNTKSYEIWIGCLNVLLLILFFLILINQIICLEK